MTIQRACLAIIALAALAAMPGHARAQQDVLRDAFSFQGSSLEVEVDAESAGRIRLVRGQRSRIEVAGRAPNGFTSAALGGRGVRRLTLTALGTEHADFIVTVPEDVRVRVSWPGAARSELFGPLARNASFAWDLPHDRPAFETIRPSHAATRPASPAQWRMPRIIDIGDAHRLVRLTVRTGADTFALSPAAHEALRGDVLRIEAGNDADISIDVPSNSRLTIRLDGRDALLIDGLDAEVLCDDVLAQTLPDGSRWFTLTPVPRAGCARLEPAAPHISPAGRRT